MNLLEDPSEFHSFVFNQVTSIVHGCRKGVEHETVGNSVDEASVVSVAFGLDHGRDQFGRELAQEQLFSSQRRHGSYAANYVNGKL